MNNSDTQGFYCSHCQRKVSTDKQIGTHNRNHCPYCLYSKHVDQIISGDRKSDCHAEMEPIGLTFKNEGLGRQGELMLIHQCLNCSKISINRLAADDKEGKIMEIFEQSLNLDPDLVKKLTSEGIKVLNESDRSEIKTQLFGKNHQ